MDDPLAVYLHDHLAGSSFAVELLEKLATEFTGTWSGDIARELLEQVRIDRSTLEQLIAKVGKATPDLYDALGWIAERVSTIRRASERWRRLRQSASASLASVLFGRPSKSTRMPTVVLRGSTIPLSSRARSNNFKRPINIA
jgi:hypothetical protein